LKKTPKKTDDDDDDGEVDKGESTDISSITIAQNNSCSLDESLESKGIILLEKPDESPLYCKKMLLDLVDTEINVITLYINSWGGEFTAFSSLHDTVKILQKKFKKTVYTIANGTAASGAALVLQAGTKRLATKNAIIMVHQVSSKVALESNTSEIAIELETMKKFQKIFFSVFAEKMGMTLKELEDFIGDKDRYFGAKEAKKYGLIDEVITF
jgi:ATP-dependent Clp endopeptidase proteolytic subunit ClpP